MYEAKYLDEVFKDVDIAKKWYKEQQEGLEVRFANEIETAILKILKMPTSYSIRYKNVRIAHPKIFPYNIHFYIDVNSKMVNIIGIVFNKRQNALKLDRK